ncbi:MAG: PAS domain S-box protein [Prolixibacteraceae bacterium]
MNSSQSKRFGAFKIALVFFSFSAMYIVFSDFLAIQVPGKYISRETLTTIQLYKGLAFVFIASVALYVLIQREINAANSYIRSLEKQKEKLRRLLLDKEKIERRLQHRNSFIETILSHLPVGIAVNRKGEKTAVRLNKQFSEIYGWPEEEIIETSSFFEKVYPDPQYRKQIKERVLSDIASENPERMHWKGIEITTKQGEKRIVDAQNIPVPKQNLMISTVQDVTEKYESEKRLKESEIKFSSLFKLNPVATVFTRFEDGAVLEVNDSYCKLFGYSKEELISGRVKSPRIWKNPEERKKVLEILQRDNAVHGYEAQAICKDGKVIDALSYLQLIEITGEKSIISITLDITEQKKNVIKLKESEERFRAIFENSLTPIAIADDSGNFLSVNKAAEDAFGYSQRELLQMKVDDLHTSMPPDAATQYREYLKKNQAKGEFNFISKSGEEHTVMYQAIRIAENFNLSVMMDITPRIVAEQNLEKSKNLLEKTINNLNEAVIVADKDRTVLIANAPVEHIFGYKPEEITGKSTALLHINEESFRKLAEQGKPELEKNGFFHTNYTMRRKDGNLVDTEISVTVITEESGLK